MSEHNMGLIDPEKMGALEQVSDGVAMVHAFANAGVIYGRGEVLIVDASSPLTARMVIDRVREETNERIAHLVYTHGHVDHAGGAPAFLMHAAERSEAPPEIWAHEDVERRFARYGATWAWNNEVNRRQFGMPRGSKVFPESFVKPTHTYRDRATFQLAGEKVELRHAKAETDDATWVYLPERSVAIVGDILIGSLPNAGNPNKPQRYTLGWAEALEEIAALKPRHVLPGHGRPVQGDHALEVLTETARALRFIHDAVLERMNAGMWPDQIVDAQIALPPDLAAKSYLQPLYGCVPFIVRDVLRFYAGWWGGDPAELVPASRAEVARELIALTGEAALALRIRALVAGGQARLALHLATLLQRGCPGDRTHADLVAEVLEALTREETSFIARNYYAALAQNAREHNA
jgi:alkyl sulfatase BDS1-like metallo-beta-lactamase superfamily hydrolase